MDLGTIFFLTVVLIIVVLFVAQPFTIRWRVKVQSLIVLLSLTLASCSLAVDITPPPGYRSPTPLPTITPAARSPQATWTPEHATVTSEASPTSIRLITPLADFITTKGASLGNITGYLVNGSGGGSPEGLKVTLFGFDKDQSGNYQKVMGLEEPVDPNGSYSFKGVEIPQDRAFLIITSLEGVEYQSDPVTVGNATSDYVVPITIYEKTDDLNLLSINQVQLIFELSSQNSLQVTELFNVTNPGKLAIVVPSDGTSIPFIHNPKNVGKVQYQLSQGSTQLLNATGGFAMLPGAEKQYGFIASYTMPYSRSLKFEQPFTLPVSSLTVFIPQGMDLHSKQLTDAGSQDIQGQSYQIYQVKNLASDSALSLTISGKPGASTGFKLDRQTAVLIGIFVVGILFIGLGLYLYLRDRARLKKENDGNEGETDIDNLRIVQ